MYQARQQLAYLIHRRPIRDHQHIIELFTVDNGKIAVIEYLNKKTRQHQLQPFSLVEVSLAGKSDLKQLKHAELQKSSSQLTGRYLYSGFYLNELISRLLPSNIAAQTLFQQYHLSLNKLAQQMSIEPILRQFELALLDELGLALDFSVINEYPHENYFQYIEQQGLVPWQDCANQKFERSALLAIAENTNLNKTQQQIFKQLMRAVFKPLLGNKPLKSKTLFQS